jgi:DUF2892 family protein
MKRNVGGIERGARVLVGLTLLSLAIFHVLTGTVAIMAYVVGTLALLTAVFAFCPAWTFFRINTSRPKTASR